MFHHGAPLLTDQGIREGIADGTISISPAPADEQFQPASLDVRIGRARVYDRGSWNVAAVRRNAQDILDGGSDTFWDGIPTSHATHIPDEDQHPILIPPGAFAELFYKERIRSTYTLSRELRSSMGRRRLFMTNIFPDAEGSDRLASVWNQAPRPLLLYSGMRFDQVFLHPQHPSSADGRALRDPDAIAALFPEFAQDRLISQDGLLLFRLGAYIKRMRPSDEPLDTNRKYPDEEVYETIPLPDAPLYRTMDERPPALRTGDFAVAQLSPALDLPPTIGVRLLSQLPRSDLTFTGQHRVNAGWVDPGYRGNITAHPFRWYSSLPLQRGMVFAAGVVYQYDRPCGRAYGSEGLGSHYQGSAGSGARV